MSSHTPGPWHQHTHRPERIILNGSAGYEVRHAWDDNLGPNPADVRLMAAAPELLVAAKEAYRVLVELCADEAFCLKYALDYPSHPLQLRAAIAKAEGRE